MIIFVNRIRKVVYSTKIIVDYAGNGIGSSVDNNIATSGSIMKPYALYMDSIGRLYITETESHVVRIVTSTGALSTFAGSAGTSSTSSTNGNGDYGQATSALLNRPSGIWGNSLGDVFITDTNNYKVRLINTSGIIASIAGTGIPGNDGDGGLSTSANMVPWGIFGLPDGTLFVCDDNSLVVRVLSGNTPTAMPTAPPTTVPTIMPMISVVFMNFLLKCAVQLRAKLYGSCPQHLFYGLTKLKNLCMYQVLMRAW